MKKKVIFTALSNIIVGGLRTDKNFLISEDVISGAVIRAGFANDILLDNPNYECDIAIDNGKYNYVIYDENMCRGLSESQKKIYKEFSNMKFSFFYPNDSIPAPFTTKVCKTCGTDHALKDILFENGRLSCKECEDSLKRLKNQGFKDKDIEKIPTRMENLKGLIHWNGKKYVSTKVEKSLSTHTSINYVSHTSREDYLFSIKAIKKGTQFVGYIDDCETGLVEKGKIIYVGKYSSNGFGKLQITDVLDINSENLEIRICEFNKRFNSNFIDNKEYISMLLLSDAKLLSTNNEDKILTTKKYNNIWTNAIFGENSIFTIEQVFAQNTFYSGFDTSKPYGKWKNEPEILTLRGTSFKIFYDISKKDEALQILQKLEDTGIGHDTKNGYGQISICHKIHNLGVNCDE